MMCCCRFRAVHEEVVKLDQDFGATFSGVLTDDEGRIRALWGSYAEQVCSWSCRVVNSCQLPQSMQAYYIAATLLGCSEVPIQLVTQNQLGLAVLAPSDCIPLHICTRVRLMRLLCASLLYVQVHCEERECCFSLPLLLFRELLCTVIVCAG
jgi:hypothetical protein